VRPAGVEDRVTGTPALGVGADRDPGHSHDRLDIRFVHAVDDHGHIEPVGDEDIEGEVGRVSVQLVGELGQRASGPLRATGRIRDPDAGPTGVCGDVLPARDAALDL